MNIDPGSIADCPLFEILTFMHKLYDSLLHHNKFDKNVAKSETILICKKYKTCDDFSFEIICRAFVREISK